MFLTSISERMNKIPKEFAVNLKNDILLTINHYENLETSNRQCDNN